MLAGKTRITFGLTEPEHGSDATHMETTAVRETARRRGRLAHQRREDVDHRHAHHALRAVRAHQRQGRRREGHHLLPGAHRRPGVKIEEYLWTFNMPTDHPRVSFTDVWVPTTRCSARKAAACTGAALRAREPHPPGRQLSLGAAHYCVNESVRYARERKPFGKALAATRASSSRWWNWPRSARCCAC
jgi:acyl-CoA dehydrogenase